MLSSHESVQIKFCLVFLSCNNIILVFQSAIKGKLQELGAYVGKSSQQICIIYFYSTALFSPLFSVLVASETNRKVLSPAKTGSSANFIKNQITYSWWTIAILLLGLDWHYRNFIFELQSVCSTAAYNTILWNVKLQYLE